MKAQRENSISVAYCIRIYAREELGIITFTWLCRFYYEHYWHRKKRCHKKWNLVQNALQDCVFIFSCQFYCNGNEQALIVKY
jgi:hypothetical protein